MKKDRFAPNEDDIVIRSRNRSGMRKRLISMINRADDRQIMKLYEYTHRMMRDSLD